MEKRRSPKLKIAIIHPDLGIGGAERLIVDAAVELSLHGHNVHLFTAHHDKNRCFEETIAGDVPVVFMIRITNLSNSFFQLLLFVETGFTSFYHCCCFVVSCNKLEYKIVVWCLLLLLFRSISSHSIWWFPTSSHLLPFPCCMCLSKMHFCCTLCAFLVALVRCYTGRSGLCCHSLVENETVSKDLLLAKHTTMLRRIYRRPIDMIEEATTGMADLLLVNSRFTASTFARTFHHLHSKGFEPAVLYPAVNVEQFNGPCSYRLNFLSINRFERKKNLQLAISAFALLRSLKGNAFPGHKPVEATLTVVGGFDKRLKENVEYLEELKWLAESEGVSDRVDFVTSCSTAERNKLLSECLCVLYTPKDEHFGIVPLEAMAARKPVVACNSGGPVETIKHEVTGFLCDPTPLDFALAMSKLISNREMAETMGKEAYQHVSEKFSTKTFGEQLNHYVINVHHRRIE